MLDTLDVDIDLLKKDLANGIGKGPWSKSLNCIFPIKYLDGGFNPFEKY